MGRKSNQALNFSYYIQNELNCPLILNFAKHNLSKASVTPADKVKRGNL